MQLIYFTSLTPEEYLLLGKGISVPEPKECPHPSCQMKIPPENHGGYERNIITFGLTAGFFIRRYYCSYCGHTFSYLPSFCLPYFQYGLELIFLNLLCHFFKLVPFLEALIQAKDLSLQRKHRQFNRKRFLNNLAFIQLVLRSLEPRIRLPDKADKRREPKRYWLLYSPNSLKFRPSPQVFRTIQSIFYDSLQISLGL